MAEEPIVVAVRARPLLPRELELSQTCILEMGERRTSLTDPSTGNVKDFAFDNHFWSVDKSRGVIADNQIVYNDFASKLVDSVSNGVNSYLIAYGATGAGKSHTLFGFRGKAGLAQLCVDGIFKKLGEGTTLALSLYSIYDEKVTDMLTAKPTATSPLRIVEHPAAGVFLPKLTQALASTPAEAAEVVSSALLWRAIAATRLSSSSSRCHIVFRASVYRDADAVPVTLTLVDMAGNEALVKLSPTDPSATASINRSVAVFNQTVDALAKNGSATHAVPYPRSALTWLLKDALGGAARTQLLAFVSPASDAYDVTLATLRLADRVRRIRTRPQPFSAASRTSAATDVAGEVTRLEQLRSARGLTPASVSFSTLTEKQKEEYSAYQADIETWGAVLTALRATPASLAESWSVRAATRAEAVSALGLERGHKSSDSPHLIVLDDDPLLSRRLCYAMNKPVLRVCSASTLPPPTAADIVVTGLQLLTEHAKITCRDGAVTLIPAPNARVFVNGSTVSAAEELTHAARIVMGASLTFVYEGAAQDIAVTNPEISYASCQHELSKTAIASMIGLDEVVFRQSAEEEGRLRAEQRAALATEVEQCQRGFQLSQDQFTRNLASVTERIAAAHADGEARLARAGETQLPQVRHDVGEATRRVNEERVQLIADWEKSKGDYQSREEKLRKKMAKIEAMGDSLSDAKKVEANRRRKLKEQSLMRVLPMINAANALCVELGQLQVRSSIKLGQNKAEADAAAAMAEQNGATAAAGAGGAAGGASDTGVSIKVTNTDMDVEVLYTEDGFADLLFRWRELYSSYLDDGVVTIPPRDEDNPFHITPQGPQLIGTCRVYLQGLFYLLGIAEKTPILDYKGDTQGKLDIQVLPLPKTFGKDNDEIYFPEEDITELENDSLTFLIRIRRASGLPKRLSKNVFIRYRCFFDDSVQESEPALLASVNPKIEYRRSVRKEAISKDWIKSLHDAMIEIQVFGEFPNNADLIRSDPLWQRLVTVLDDAEFKAKKTVQRLQKELDETDKELRGVGRSGSPDGDEDGSLAADAALAADDANPAAAAAAEQERAKPVVDPETILGKIQEAYDRQCVLETEKATLERRLMVATKEAQDAMVAATEARARNSSFSRSKSHKKDKKDKRDRGSSLSTLAEESEYSVSRIDSSTTPVELGADVRAAIADTQSGVEVSRALAQVATATAEREQLRTRLAENQERQAEEAAELAQLRAELTTQRQRMEELEQERKQERQAMVQAAFNGDDNDKTLAEALRRQEAEASEAKRRLADAESELAKNKAVFEVMRKSKEDALAEEREEREAREREHDEEVRRLRDMLKKERELRVQQQQQQQQQQQAGPAAHDSLGPMRASNQAGAVPAPGNGSSSNGNQKSTGCVVM